MRLRLTFSKQGPLRYTGHLDLHNLWERAARRAGLPLAYSQGFHPQPKINLASALPLGFSSRAEVMDIWLKEDCEVSRLRSDLQAALPADIQILDIQAIDERAPKLQTIVVSAEYEATLSEPVPDLEQKIAALLEAASLPRERRGKAYDLRPLIESVEAAPAEGSEKKRLVMRLAARESATGRPEEVLDALGVPIESARIERTRLLFLDSPTIRLSD
jgi:radical SAM-linked protein